MVGIEVIKPGLFTTIQDRGRLGYMQYGIPRSGPLDQQAYLNIQTAFQNRETTVLECNVIGCSLSFQETIQIYLSGADMQWRINGRTVERNQILNISNGDELSGKPAIDGMRGYIGISGHLNIPKILKSKSTYNFAKMGGIDGREMRKDDIIEISSNKPISDCPVLPIIDYNLINKIDFQRGPEWDVLSPSLQQQFTSTPFNISPNTNRMGAQLLNNPLIQEKSISMKSVPVFPGIIQLPPNGNPIVLLNDCQTTGGYPRIAYLSQSSINKLVQIKPNQEFWFCG